MPTSNGSGERYSEEISCPGWLPTKARRRPVCRIAVAGRAGTAGKETKDDDGGGTGPDQIWYRRMARRDCRELYIRERANRRAGHGELSVINPGGRARSRRRV